MRSPARPPAPRRGPPQRRPAPGTAGFPAEFIQGMAGLGIGFQLLQLHFGFQRLRRIRGRGAGSAARAGLRLPGRVQNGPGQGPRPSRVRLDQHSSSSTPTLRRSTTATPHPLRLTAPACPQAARLNRSPYDQRGEPLAAAAALHAPAPQRPGSLPSVTAAAPSQQKGYRDLCWNCGQPGAYAGGWRMTCSGCEVAWMPWSQGPRGDPNRVVLDGHGNRLR